MTINTVVLKMTTAFGGGDPYTQKGWTATISILMVVFVIINFFNFAVCKERVVENAGSDDKKENVSFVKGLAGLLKNKYWLLLVVCILAMYFMMSTFFGSAVYFTQYNMNDAGKYATVSNLLSMTQIIGLFLTPFIMKFVSKKTYS